MTIPDALPGPAAAAPAFPQPAGGGPFTTHRARRLTNRPSGPQQGRMHRYPAVQIVRPIRAHPGSGMFNGRTRARSRSSTIVASNPRLSSQVATSRSPVTGRQAAHNSATCLNGGRGLGPERAPPTTRTYPGRRFSGLAAGRPLPPSPWVQPLLEYQFRMSLAPTASSSRNRRPCLAKAAKSRASPPASQALQCHNPR